MNIFLNRVFSITCTQKFLGLTSSHTLVKSCRSLQTNSRICAKMYLEHENKYAYNIMKNKGYSIVPLDVKKQLGVPSKDYFETLIKKQWSRETPQQLYKTFAELSIYSSENKICISNPMFDTFIDHLTDSIKLSSDEEMEELFYTLANWPDTPSIRSRNIIEVWAALDDECLKRYREWSFDKLLRFIALFYLINVSRASDFTMKAMQKLASRAKQLSPAQLVQTLFFVGIIRVSPFDMHNLELLLAENISLYTIDELAIMSMGFFKSKTPIRNMEIVNKLIEKVLENTKDIHEVSLAALLKIIRYSMKYPADDKIYQLLDALQHQIPRLSVMCCVHIALAGTSTLTLHEQCLDNIADHVIKNIDNARLKDMERLVLTYGMFDYRPNCSNDFLETVLKELRKPERSSEFERHGRTFACCVSFLLLHKIYPVDLMNKVLDPLFLEKYYGKSALNCGREILTLHNVSQIFCKDKMIHSLATPHVRHLSKRYTDYVPNENYKRQYNITEKMMIDVSQVLLDARGGSEFVLADHILTHHQRGDIIICNDKSGQPASVADFPVEDFGFIQKPPNDNKWIALVIAGRNVLLRDSRQVHGPLKAKIRELRALGWNAGLVPWNVWTTLKDHEEKLNYLNCLISEISK